MKVLYLTNIPSPYRVDFFNELGKYCELTVIYERKIAADRDENWKSENSINFKAVFLKGFSYKNDRAICPSILPSLNSSKFDIFIVGGYSTPTGMLAIETLSFKKVPFILNSDGGFIKNDKPLIKFIKKHYIGKANWWLSTGKETSDYLTHYGAKPQNISLYPFSSLRKDDIKNYPADKNEKSDLRKELNIIGEKVVLGVGQYIHRKGFDLVIHYWNLMPSNITLLLIGSGPEKETYEELILRMNLKNVRIIGFKDKKTLQKYYRASDIFIMPTREDIWGLVINEAMAQGLPIISTENSIAALELVENGENGFYIENPHYNFKKKLLLLLNDNKKLLEMGKNSIDTIKQYTIENMAKVHMDILNNLK